MIEVVIEVEWAELVELVELVAKERNGVEEVAFVEEGENKAVLWWCYFVAEEVKDSFVVGGNIVVGEGIVGEGDSAGVEDIVEEDIVVEDIAGVEDIVEDSFVEAHSLVAGFEKQQQQGSLERIIYVRN